MPRSVIICAASLRVEREFSRTVPKVLSNGRRFRRIDVEPPSAESQSPNGPQVRLVSVREAARYLGTTPATLYTKVWRREIPFVKFGRSVRFDIRDLDQMIEAMKVNPSDNTQSDLARGHHGTV
jgi:excisionase family DNA binding protein